MLSGNSFLHSRVRTGDLYGKACAFLTLPSPVLHQYKDETPHLHRYSYDQFLLPCLDARRHHYL